LATFAFVLPIIAGKEETDRTAMERVGVPGPDRDAYVAARRAAGLRREAVWHQKTPMGTFAIVLLEGDDVPASLRAMANSDQPFDRQFRELVRDVHGVDLQKDPPPDVSLVGDYRF
jgi:hypothetical protein